jgi:hypothetical protein
MRKRLGKAAVLGCTLAIVAAASASALHLVAGNLVVDGDGGFAPTTLSKDDFTPIKAFFHGKIRTTDGTRPSPLRTLVLEVDRNSLVVTRGLPKCSLAKLRATTTPQARRLCPGAIVGTGFGTVLTELPEQAPIRTSSALTIFNGPVVHGNPTAIGHAHLDYPVPATYLAQAEIEKVSNGRYGYRIEVDFPKIVNWYGSPISGRIEINRKWHHQGRRLSYANARCVDGRLYAQVELGFKDETRLKGTAFKPCTVRR